MAIITVQTHYYLAQIASNYIYVLELFSLVSQFSFCLKFTAVNSVDHVTCVFRLDQGCAYKLHHHNFMDRTFIQSLLKLITDVINFLCSDARQESTDASTVLPRHRNKLRE